MVVTEFFNALYLRKQSNSIPSYRPQEFGKGGISQNYIWYPNVEQKTVVRPTAEIVGVLSVAVGSIFPFRDILYVKTVINQSENPNDESTVFDICMCYHAYDALKLSGVIEQKMDYETAKGWKAFFDMYCKVKFGKHYKKELHQWLQQKNTLDTH